MRIAHIGATGKVGSKIATELLHRGHDVIAISRTPATLPAHDRLTPVVGDLTDPVGLSAVLRGADAIVSSAALKVGTSQGIIDAVRNSGVKRFIAIGGASALYDKDGVRLIDISRAPPEWLPILKEGVLYLDLLQPVSDLDWTYASPPMQIGPGERTGSFRVGSDKLLYDENGESRISYEDFAIAIADEVEAPRHTRSVFNGAY